MIDLSWGGYTNGALPDSILVTIDGSGHKLEPAAAAQYLAMRAALLTAVGRTIDVAPGADSANRTLSQQQADYALYQSGGNVAAVPGTSNHGWGRAVDITGYEGNSRWISPTTGHSYYVDLPVWLWLQAHAADYGFHWATGDASGEGWHWESYNTPGTTTTTSGLSATTIQEDDMPLTDADVHAIINGLLNYPAFTPGPGEAEVSVSQALKEAHQVSNAIFAGGPSMPDAGKSIAKSLAELNGTVGRVDAQPYPVLPADGSQRVLTPRVDNAQTNTIVRLIAKKLGIPTS